MENRELGDLQEPDSFVLLFPTLIQTHIPTSTPKNLPQKTLRRVGRQAQTKRTQQNFPNRVSKKFQYKSFNHLLHNTDK